MKEKLQEEGAHNICPIALILREDQVLFGFRKYDSSSVWTCPGGRCDEGETIGEALVREIYEEIGINDLEILDYLGDVKGSWKDDVVPVFLCKIQGEPKLMEPHKFREWKWFKKNELPKNFINSEVESLLKKLM